MAIKTTASTSYTARGTEPVVKGFDKELGSAIAAPIRDLVPELGNRAVATKTYDRMARTDAITSVSLRAAKVPILGADFYVDPIGEEQIHLDVGEFVYFNLFEGMSHPFSFALQKMLKMFQHGFAVMEPVYELREWSPKRSMANRRKYTMLRKLAPRPATTIKEIELDDSGGPVNVIQNKADKSGKITEIKIPIEKAVVFTFGDADDLYGESILRSAYPHWFYKTHLYKIDAIQKERHGIGIPVGTLPPGYSEDDKKFMNELLANLRTNERAFITQPPGFEIGFAKPEGQLVNVLESASYHDIAILLNVMAEFMMLGLNDGGGGRSTSGAQLDIFYKSEWFLANFICDCFNQFLIPKLVRWNFETTLLPKLRVRNIGQSKDLQQLSAALANVVDKEIITTDLPTEQWTRRVFDMPAKAEDRPLPATATAIDAISGVGNNGNESTVKNNGGQGNMGKATTET